MYLLKMADIQEDVKSNVSSTSQYNHNVRDTWTMTNVNKSTQTSSELYSRQSLDNDEFYEDISSPTLDKICVMM